LTNENQGSRMSVMQPESTSDRWIVERRETDETTPILGVGNSMLRSNGILYRLQT